MRQSLFLPLALLAFAGCGNPQIAKDAGADLAAPSSPDLAGTDGPAPMGCSPACAGLTPHCNATGHCVTCLVDGDCAIGERCNIASPTSASCVPGCSGDAHCPNGNKCCAANCTDPATDITNCGGCGIACMAAHAASVCSAGACGVGACDDGFGDCNKDPKDGCEDNIHTDAMNCTMCGMVCQIANATAGCADGCYIAACNLGFADCNKMSTDGCETSVMADPRNCGACNQFCFTLPNAVPVCAGGACTIASCGQGFGDCDNNPANGCETNLATDAMNCGQCKTVCGPNLVCKFGSCTCPNCNFPNAFSTCVNNQCAMGQCNPGFADCNMNPNDGCEINIDTDNANCGACGVVCPPMMGGCGVGICGQGLNPIPVFDSLSSPGLAIALPNGVAGCGSKIAVSADSTIRGIGVRLTLLQPGNLVFVLFDFSAPKQPLLVTAPKAVIPAGDVWEVSDVFPAVKLQAGHTYDIGAVSDVTGHWDVNLSAVNTPPFSSQGSNPYFLGFNAPQEGPNRGGFDCAVRLFQ